MQSPYASQANTQRSLRVERVKRRRRHMDPIRTAIDRQLESPPLEPTRRRRWPEAILNQMCDDLRECPSPAKSKRRRRRRIKVQTFIPRHSQLLDSLGVVARS